MSGVAATVTTNHVTASIGGSAVSATLSGSQGPKGDTGEQGPQGNPTTVNSKSGPSITLTPDDLDDTATVHKFITALEKINLDNLSGVNTGDQTLSGLGGQPLNSNLTALSSYNTSGLLVQTAANTFAGRSISGTTNQITVTNGDGVSGNPTLSFPSSLIAPGALGLGGGTPTHTLTLPSTSTGIAIYNTADQTTNFERFRMFWSSNVLNFIPEKGGSGSERGIVFGAGDTTRLAVNPSANPFFDFYTNYSSNFANETYVRMRHTSAANTGIFKALEIIPTINQSSTAGYTALLINPTETTTGSGTKRLIDAQVGGSNKFYVDNQGKARSIFTLVEPYTVTGDVRGVDVYGTFAPAADSSKRIWGLNFQVTTSGAVNYTSSLALTGLEGMANHTGSGTVTGAVGVLAYCAVNSTGTLNTGIGIYAYGATKGSGSIGTYYGIRVADQTAATTNYAIYTGRGDIRLMSNTADKLGLWGASPVAQPTTGVASATFTGNSGTAVNDASTFDGYTIKQVVKALRNIGLLA